MKIEQVNIDELRRAEYNPRKMTDTDRASLAASIEKFGIVDPIIVNKNPKRKNVIVGGHQRLEILEARGDKTAPVFYVDLNEQDERELNIRLNANGGRWDIDLLARNFTGNQLESWGVDLKAIGASWGVPSKPEKQDNKDLQKRPPKAKHGEIYQLGRHRLACCDATDQDTINRLIGDLVADILFVDPPYSSGGHQETGKTAGSIGRRDGAKIESDNLSTRGYVSLINKAIACVPSLHTAFVFCDWKMFATTQEIVETKGFRVRNLLVWDKKVMGMGMPFRNQHELCVFASKLAGKIGDGKTPNVLQCARDRDSEHPTPKPTALIKRMLNQVQGAVIYDPFCGGGSTLIACEDIDRTCLTCDKDPVWVDATIKRFEKTTGTKAKLVKR